MARERGEDPPAACAPPGGRAGGAARGAHDQIEVIPHLDPEVLADPKPFCGYSDNTHLLHWLWSHGVAGFYGGSTQVHLGPGPTVDDVHVRSLRAALLDGGTIELTEPGISQDFGIDWTDPRALTDSGPVNPTTPWIWAGPARRVTGPSWGGCLEVLEQILIADRLDARTDALDGAVLLVETSEEVPPAPWVHRVLRAMGERGLIERLSGVLVARPPASALDHETPPQDQEFYRIEQRDTVIDVVSRYNPDAVICVGVPFGHTRPQWIVPYGGAVTLDGAQRQVFAEY